MARAKEKARSAAKSEKGAGEASRSSSSGSTRIRGGVNGHHSGSATPWSSAACGSAAGTRSSAAAADAGRAGRGGGRGVRTSGPGTNSPPAESARGGGLSHVGLRSASRRATPAARAAPRMVAETQVFTGNAEIAARGQLARQGVCVGKLISATRERMHSVRDAPQARISSSTAATAVSSSSSSNINMGERGVAGAAGTAAATGRGGEGGGGGDVELLAVLSVEELVGRRRDQAERDGKVVDLTGDTGGGAYPGD